MLVCFVISKRYMVKNVKFINFKSGIVGFCKVTFITMLILSFILNRTMDKKGGILGKIQYQSYYITIGRYYTKNGKRNFIKK